MLITIVMQLLSDLLPHIPAQDVGLVLHQPLLDGLAVLLNPFFANSLQTRTGPSSPLTLHCLSLAIQRHLKVLIVGLKGGSNCKIATQSTFLHRHLLCWHHPPLLASSSSGSSSLHTQGWATLTRQISLGLLSPMLHVGNCSSSSQWSREILAPCSPF